MSILNGKQIIVSGNVLKNISGIDMSSPMKIYYNNGGYMVFKRAGFTGWVAHGETGYCHPEYYLVETECRDGKSFIKKVIERVEVNRGTWLLIKNRLVLHAKQLAKG